MSEGMSEEEQEAVTRLCVSGYEGRCNDVLYSSPESPNQERGVVCYFGGDIQDFPENMENHRDNKNYLKWSLDNTVTLLRKAFAGCHIVAVRPSRMDLKTFSCFDNFVPSGNCGVPNHVTMHHSLEHLEKLLENIAKQLNEKETSDKNEDLMKSDLKVIGFSKGCVVLNQFIYEFHTLKDQTNNFIARIKDMYWLDGGHSGGKNTWITTKYLLENLTTTGTNIHIHVTPYQIKDDRRPWIKKEEKIFYNTLYNLKGPVQRHVHFVDTPPSIFMHFKVLEEFHKIHS